MELEQTAEVTHEQVPEAPTIPETPTVHIHGPLNAAMWQNLVANSRVEQPEPPEALQQQAEPPEAASPEAEPVEEGN